MAIITVDNLKYRYPLQEKLALDGITFSVEPGEFIGVIGGNNAGKSTLCHALCGIVPHFYKGAYGGNVVLAGLTVKETSVATLSEKVGIIFQNPFNQITGSKITVYEEIAFGLENMGVPADEMRGRIDAALTLLNIMEYKDRNPFALSGGQMQRLAIASIIAMQPDVIILDEPTSQLDPAGSKEVFKAIDILSEQGITIIMVEHKMEHLVAHSDRILLMDNGKVVDYATPTEIFSRDDIDTYGIEIPVYTQFAKKLALKNNKGQYPVTLAETKELLRGVE